MTVLKIMKTTFIAIRQILQITFSILLLIALPAIVFTIVTSKTNIVSGMQSFVVLTGSMNPTMPVGSIVYTVKQPAYKVGDVIAFKRGDINVTHRVVDVRNKNGQVSY